MILTEIRPLQLFSLLFCFASSLAVQSVCAALQRIFRWYARRVSSDHFSIVLRHVVDILVVGIKRSRLPRRLVVLVALRSLLRRGRFICEIIEGCLIRPVLPFQFVQFLLRLNVTSFVVVEQRQESVSQLALFSFPHAGKFFRRALPAKRLRLESFAFLHDYVVFPVQLCDCTAQQLCEQQAGRLRGLALGPGERIANEQRQVVVVMVAYILKIPLPHRSDDAVLEDLSYRHLD
mmetsp:Transcript_26761/g.63453  ORF Transcript_26761/g.63453 Transcript_26761/m.63453 type:complete len:234 (-) Transcript_26761:426-1127(-)